MKVKFIEDGNVTVEGEVKTLFKKGRTVDLNPASAARWIRRNVAVDAEVAKAEAAEQKKAADAKAGKDKADAAEHAKREKAEEKARKAAEKTSAKD